MRNQLENGKKGLWDNYVVYVFVASADSLLIIPSLAPSIIALSLYINGFEKEAKKVMDSLKKSPLYNPKNSLFKRQYNSEKINSQIMNQ